MQIKTLLYVPLMLVSFNVASAANTTSIEMDALVNLITLIEQGIVLVTLTDCTLIKQFLGLSYNQILAKGNPDVSTITLSLYTNTEVTQFNLTTNVASQIRASSSFDPNLPVVLFTPGYMATANSPISRNMGKRLALTNAFNVITVDPYSVLGWFYYASAAMVRFVGLALGNMLADFYNAGTTQFYAIGHSLGAHISSFAGKKFYNLTGTKLDRITGLDPAGPCFFKEVSTLKLTSTDAKFVDVIHTDTGVFGITDPCGHIDFYPNGGNSQPGCLAFMCSHNSSWLYYNESITEQTDFPSVPCKDWWTFKTGACGSNTPQVYMGYPTPPTSRGVYYLKTGTSYPFGLGQNGITTPATVDFVTASIMWWNSLFG